MILHLFAIKIIHILGHRQQMLRALTPFPGEEPRKLVFRLGTVTNSAMAQCDTARTTRG